MNAGNLFIIFVSWCKCSHDLFDTGGLSTDNINRSIAVQEKTLCSPYNWDSTIAYYILHDLISAGCFGVKSKSML